MGQNWTSLDMLLQTVTFAPRAHKGNILICLQAIPNYSYAEKFKLLYYVELSSGSTKEILEILLNYSDSITHYFIYTAFFENDNKKLLDFFAGLPTDLEGNKYLPKL